MSEREELDDETVSGNDATIIAGDATVVAGDATVVGDHTVVARGDTVVTSDETVVVSDATVVSPGSRKRRRSREAGASTQQTGSVAPPVAEPRDERALTFEARGAGLDPDHPIARAPGMLPWEQLPSGERGVAQGLPVSYGARPRTDQASQLGADEVQRRLGPPPEGHLVLVRQGREALPSLTKRERRRRAITLIAYAVVVSGCVAGLVLLARAAFGW